MKYRLLGNSGLRVSEVCLGTMTFGEDWGFGASKEESRKVFEAFRERGGNFIDSANFYTNGTSESIVGELIAPDRGRYVVSTKYSVTTRPDDPNAMGNARKNMVQSLERSLKRMNTDYVDVFWVHVWDHTTPVDEVMRGLDDLVRSGKVLYLGVSDTPAWVISQSNMMAELRGWSRFVAMQIEYSLIERTSERELIPMARALDIAVLPWRAVGEGILAGKYAGKSAAEIDSKRAGGIQGRLTDRNLKIAAEVDAVAKEVGRSSAQVAIRWTMQQAGIVIPILGVRKVEQIEDNLGALDFELSKEHMDRLGKASAIELGFPHDFVQPEGSRLFMYGPTKVLNHHER